MATHTQKAIRRPEDSARAEVRASCLAQFKGSIDVFKEILDHEKTTSAEKIKALELCAKIAGLLQAESVAPAPVKGLPLQGLSQPTLDELDQLAKSEQPEE